MNCHRAILAAGVVCLGTLKVGAADLSAAEFAAARKLTNRKCTKCHKFYDPQKYPADEWARWMDRMVRKSKVTPADEERIRRYLSSLGRTGRR